MTSIYRRSFSKFMAVTAAAIMLGAGAAQAEVKGLEIMAPSGPGSGYDQLARTIQTVLQDEKLASGIQVQNVAGGGGTVGLSQYVTGKKRNPTIMIVGFALVGGVLTTKSAITLDQTTPVARLMGESDVIVVPANSDIKTIADLVAKMKANPGSVSWAGGSIGGFDHVLVGLIAKAAGVDPTKVNYVVHAGGGEVMASTLGGHATVGVSGVEEFRPQIQAGQVRALAISADKRIPGFDVPTLKEAGVDVSLVNWRGIMTHPETREVDKKAISEMLATMVKSPAWKAALEKRGWIDTYQPTAEFGPFLKQQQQQIEGALKDAGILK
ncbi:tripartite tricarboxylate transporter substrate binding protein [Microvirga sp. VF16]|uniref:Bug family tripartite tricarboxylate transporter substrate binding protein n=1 Tax=Microvirga sp. VF16 TaxID=2807101 RepID=UPI00193E1839|nr:tripartite tricarboxylate transporter substrate-binding protein [Microvirga sp. VF16]QRM34238.1 tripartite tricarboxylate transporter substrate binding protein [Microvirga sp. VF16]